jgi:hypothetical protein
MVAGVKRGTSGTPGPHRKRACAPEGGARASARTAAAQQPARGSGGVSEVSEHIHGFFFWGKLAKSAQSWPSDDPPLPDFGNYGNRSQSKSAASVNHAPWEASAPSLPGRAARGRFREGHSPATREYFTLCKSPSGPARGDSGELHEGLSHFPTAREPSCLRAFRPLWEWPSE